MSIDRLSTQLGHIHIGSDDEDIFLPNQDICAEDFPSETASPTLEELLHTDKAKGGTALLASDDVRLKIHWLSALPNVAVSLVLQIENCPELVDKRVTKWLHMDGVWDALFTSKSGRFRALCAATYPDRVLSLIKRANLTKDMKRHLAATRREYLPSLPSNCAVASLRALGIQLDDQDKSLLITCMQNQPIEEELVDWFLANVPPRFEPHNHVRAYLSIIRHYQTKQNPTYVQAQHQRMTPAQRAEFVEFLQDDEHTHFTCFLKKPAKKVPEPSVPVVKKKEERPFFEVATEQLRKADELDPPVAVIKKIYNMRNVLSKKESRLLWNKIFSHGSWISEEKLLYIFDDFAFFNQLQVTKSYIPTLIQNLVKAKKFDTAYSWFSLNPNDDIGILLLRCETKKESPELRAILKSCWPRLKQLTGKEVGTKSITIRSLAVAEALMHALVLADLEILLDLFSLDYASFSTNMTEGYNRLLALAVESEHPEYITRALLIHVEKKVQDPGIDRALSQKLMLRQIEYFGWGDITARCFESFINVSFSSDLCTYFASPCHTGRSQALGESFVCSICPLDDEKNKRWPYNDEVICWIEQAITYAEKAKAKEALLDFAIQTSRNLLDNYPYAHVPFATIRRLAAVTKSAHIFSLAKRAQNFGALSEHEMNEVCSLTKAPPMVDGQAIVDALGGATAESVEEVLINQQYAIIDWQESLSSGDFRTIMHSLFSVWRKYPDVIRNDKIAESLGEIISPNTELWNKGDISTFSGYLALLIDNYKHIVKQHPNGAFEGKAKVLLSKAGSSAVRYIQAMTDLLNNGVRWNLHKGENCTLFTTQLEAVLQMFRAPFYLSHNKCVPSGALTALQSIVKLVLVPLPAREKLVRQLIGIYRENKTNVVFTLSADTTFEKLLTYFEQEKKTDQPLLDTLNDLAELIRDMTNDEGLKERCKKHLIEKIKIVKQVESARAELERLLVDE